MFYLAAACFWFVGGFLVNQLRYLSRVQVVLSSDELRKLLEVARARNLNSNLSGLLITNGHADLQVLFTTWSMGHVPMRSNAAELSEINWFTTLLNEHKQLDTALIHKCFLRFVDLHRAC